MSEAVPNTTRERTAGAKAAAAAQTADARAIAQLYGTCRASEFGIAEGEFREILVAIGVKYLPAGSGAEEAATFYRSLRIEELALARGCAAGSEKAWEVFLTRFREKLYDCARGLVRDDTNAHELADSLYAELYGISEREGKRASKLASYTGRGSLEGWLRTVLAQEFINRYRKGKKLVSLEEQAEAGVQFEAKVEEAAPAADRRLEESTDEALGALNPEDRYILSAYFLDDRTLAEIGKSLGVHESTISRKVEKLGKSLRKAILDGLMRRGMSERQATEALESDVRDLKVDVRAKLAQETRGSPFSERKKR